MRIGYSESSLSVVMIFGARCCKEVGLSLSGVELRLGSMDGAWDPSNYWHFGSDMKLRHALTSMQLGPVASE